MYFDYYENLVNFVVLFYPFQLLKTYTKAEAKKEISDLVKDFEKGISYFKGKDYKEAQVENDFIRPLFQFLNWNVSNRGLEPEKQVFTLQPTGKTGQDSNKRPDYLVRIPDQNTNAMKSVFFIEAKKPIYDLKTNEQYIRQVYQYAFSTLSSCDNPNNHVRLAVLTDFEEFRFFDCQDAAPLTQHRAEAFNKHVIKDWNFKEYITKFDEIWELFEYNNVVNGSLEKWYLSAKQLADNRITPDKQFLEDLRYWRLEIAKSMFRNDKNSDDYQLTKGTLLYINRIIFVKMLADRNIETDYLTNILSQIDKSKKTEIKLFELCHDIFNRLDHIYNGSMFNYDSNADDALIDNKVLKNIFESLKPENSIYTLAAMPVEIIGNVYELFIAEQIVKKAGSVSIIPKYDDKKAGGVYYTPRYIVEYIVDNTLGNKLEECKVPEDVSKIKVLDPACGSGSFLIVAYQKLLDWYKKYYFNELQKWSKKEKVEKFRNKTEKRIRVMQDANSDYFQIHLSHKLKSEILINNIFGVDIDPQAVLVTNFSLSVKALEDSTRDEIKEDNTIFNLPVLPSLKDNIKCGNSLIGSDFYDDKQTNAFNIKEKRKINTFDWSGKDGFPEIMKSGGFDIVIGNPPYVNIVNLQDYIREYLKNKYTITRNKVDLYAYFLELIIKKLTNKNSILGFLVSNSWLAIDSFQILRKIIFQNGSISKLCKMPNGTFKDAQVETVIIIYQKYLVKNLEIYSYSKDSFVKSNDILTENITKDSKYRIFVDSNIIEFELLNKLDMNKPIEDYIHFSRGVKTSNDSRFILSKKENNNCYKLLRGKNIQRYCIEYDNLWLLYRPDLMKEKVGCLPHTKDVFFVDAKIILQGRSGRRLIAYIDYDKYFVLDTAYFSNKTNLKSHSLKYFLALINSKLINFWYSAKFKTPTISGYELHQIPVIPIDFSIRTEKQMHDKLVGLVEQILENQKYLYASKNESDKILYQNICDSLDKQIDRLVYKLYDLTDEEIKIVEGE
ncbi:MAG: N-6 DNA methylase [Candidatus Kapabacteria bacterium]|nr:N-6 DNA methylase [Candidatus Kapabacteria bacterium]